ncbi:L-rhamnose mutarotase [Lacihabitans sp. CS3-21]|jgi:L-rhamnose mutarotase|uniref:L-rhamnose mutarotase n=1 Tax=Lacihabitans sp. CS3-21 TaxID=2487332 RepID=UPI0020CC0B43|nr:L-rhamnose mutarotase [Lacihabitans sp. CS3-21]MCP9747305.1 L-rhamnose mutarotase [Lacihabitans sp. CS3-21]
MKRYCFALDLKDDVASIAEYEKIHENIWPEIRETIVVAGITDMQIYRIGTRMFMIMDTEDDFSFEAKSKADAENPIVQKWENFMWTFQQALPMAKPGEKWVMMKKIFGLA